ncbi:MAG: hypothetical protein GXO07_01445 [Crenarchaeota archaeon]|nr:hypothetical protein [Thermoproteota archaeon]
MDRASLLATLTALLAGLLGALASFGVYSLFTGFQFYVSFVAGATVAVSLLGALIAYALSVLSASP